MGWMKGEMPGRVRTRGTPSDDDMSPLSLSLFSSPGYLSLTHLTHLLSIHESIPYVYLRSFVVVSYVGISFTGKG